MVPRMKSSLPSQISLIMFSSYQVQRYAMQLIDLMSTPAKSELSSVSEHYKSSTVSLRALGMDMDLAVLLDLSSSKCFWRNYRAHGIRKQQQAQQILKVEHERKEHFILDDKNAKDNKKQLY
ncbi:hypothetical protein Y1Q_0004860 [Alligator mississippiensis]|uniref:Uncharacterized protein n=1 Tax=Alligator mississippiensis TaxID=8496 RepID=A0A151NR97_ALLMI|nr:hypothetical protein Y1Q_0004860 [Alligator mississippiensis]